MKNLKIELKWAFVFMATTLAWMVIEKVLGLYTEHIDLHAQISNLFMIPAISVYVFAFLDKRNNYYDGFMSYKQGFITGVIISIIVTVLSPLTQYIASNVIGPEYFPNMIAYSVEQGDLSQLEADEYYNLKNFVIEGLIGAPIMGIMTSALVAVFTKKRKTLNED